MAYYENSDAVSATASLRGHIPQLTIPRLQLQRDRQSLRALSSEDPHLFTPSSPLPTSMDRATLTSLSLRASVPNPSQHTVHIVHTSIHTSIHPLKSTQYPFSQTFL